MKVGSDGVFVAAPIWRSFMDAALGNYPVEKFKDYKKADFNKDKNVLLSEDDLKKLDEEKKAAEEEAKKKKHKHKKKKH